MPAPTASVSALATLFGSSAVLALAILAGIKAVPGEPAEARLRTAPGGRGDPWRLRTSEIEATASGGFPVSRGAPDGEPPPARRIVRVVYPGLTSPR